MTYESTNRFKALTEENVEFESVEQDVVDSGADRAERDLSCEEPAAGTCLEFT